ncbi:unnamed protein product [Mytilus coruscus]|uniref:SGNH hydrolase-type esterase domain-containing protein n=1 Tax=Mytilus coruscus TaxID=42192 RepID=A0A6J8DDT5_MYTCO|nr:unnamed protein product [Mytilus coruscus]
MSNTTRVLILGHSFIKRLFMKIIHTWDSKLVQNLNVREAGVRTRFLGFPGGNISRLLKDEHHRIRREILKYPPDIVVLQIGGNDLDCEKFNLHVYISNVVSFINILQGTYGEKKVVVCEIFGRLSLRIPTHVYHYGKQFIDQYFYLQFENHPTVNFWFHRSRLVAQDKLFLSDGVHLNVEGTRRFFRSLRGAVLNAIK